MAEDAATRARRLITLLPLLRRQGAIPLASLATALGSDAAGIADDLTVLSMCGADERDPNQLVGVLVEDGVAEVFADLPALERPVRLTPLEARALVSALGTIGMASDNALVAKLAAFASRSVDVDDVVREVRTAFAQGGQARVIAALDVAAESGRAVRIAYASSGAAEATERVVHPYALYRWRDAWYLLAHCETAGEQRTFRVDRITAVAMTEQRFERPAGIDTSASPLPDLDALPRATVRFAADAPDLNDRDWPGATFERAADGSVAAQIPYAGTGWIARRVAARLGDAVVESPTEVRAAVAEAAREMLRQLS